MDNKVVVEAQMKICIYRPAAPAAQQVEVEAGTIGVLTGLEMHGHEQIAWVLWESVDETNAKPYLAAYLEVVGVRSRDFSVLLKPSV